MKGIKKALVGIAAGALLTLGASAPALADFLVGGGVEQGQYMINTSITGYTLSQEQTTVQQTILSVNYNPVVEMNIVEEGYMEQEIGEGAITATSNGATYGIEVSSSGISAGSMSTSNAAVATGENSYGFAMSYTETDVEVNF